MRRLVGFMLIVLLGLSGLQCSKSTDPAPPEPDPGPSPNPVNFTAADKELAASTNGFAFELFQDVVEYEDANENIFISPLSISYALGMTRNGAEGDTWQAMVDVLRQSGTTNEEINAAYLNLTSGLTQVDPTVQFDIANSIWYRLGKEVEQDFITECETYFDALVREMDWTAPGAEDTINAWIEDATSGKITEMISQPIPADVAMLLINAIYFKGAWTHQFDPDSTYDATFNLADGSTTPCRMMKLEDTLMYLYTDKFQAVDKPYGDEAFSMTIILPHYNVTLDDVMDDLTEENWTTWLGSFQKKEETIYLPRLKYSFHIKLKEVLCAMGMDIAFNPFLADFSGIFTDGVGWIGEVEHKAFVQVDEEGTEAAAVTIVWMFDTAIQGFFCDRPFLYVIHEKETGSILFMGKVANPVWEDD